MESRQGLLRDFSRALTEPRILFTKWEWSEVHICCWLSLSDIIIITVVFDYDNCCSCCSCCHLCKDNNKRTTTLLVQVLVLVKVHVLKLSLSLSLVLVLILVPILILSLGLTLILVLVVLTLVLSVVLILVPEEVLFIYQGVKIFGQLLLHHCQPEPRSTFAHLCSAMKKWYLETVDIQ